MENSTTTNKNKTAENQTEQLNNQLAPEDKKQADKLMKDPQEKLLGDFTRAEIATLKSTIAKGTTDAQFNLFLQICTNSGLNPFLNHVFCVTYKDKNSGETTMSVQIAVEGVLYLARRVPGYLGVETQLVHEKDDFKLGKVDGEMKIIEHTIGFPRGRVVGGYAIAKREGFEDVLVIMETSEVEHFKKGRNNKMWENYFQDMFKKHMVKRAAKMQYGIEINDDTPIESDSGSFEEYKPAERKEVNVEFHQEIEPDPEIVTGEDKAEKQSKLKKEQWQLIEKLMTRYGMERSEVNAIRKQRFNNIASDELNLQEIAALAKFIELEGKNRQAQKTEEKDPIFQSVDEAADLFSISQ